MINQATYYQLDDPQVYKARSLALEIVNNDLKNQMIKKEHARFQQLSDEIRAQQLKKQALGVIADQSRINEMENALFKEIARSEVAQPIYDPRAIAQAAPLAGVEETKIADNTDEQMVKNLVDDAIRTATQNIERARKLAVKAAIEKTDAAESKAEVAINEAIETSADATIGSKQRELGRELDEQEQIDIEIQVESWIDDIIDQAIEEAEKVQVEIKPAAVEEPAAKAKEPVAKVEEPVAKAKEPAAKDLTDAQIDNMNKQQLLDEIMNFNVKSKNKREFNSRSTFSGKGNERVYKKILKHYTNNPDLTPSERHSYWTEALKADKTEKMFDILPPVPTSQTQKAAKKKPEAAKKKPEAAKKKPETVVSAEAIQEQGGEGITQIGTGMSQLGTGLMEDLRQIILLSGSASAGNDNIKMQKKILRLQNKIKKNVQKMNAKQKKELENEIQKQMIKKIAKSKI